MVIHSTLAQLCDVLAGLYSDENSARRIASQSGLDDRQISFSGRSIDNWHAILTEAEKSGKVEGVVDLTVYEYDGNNKLLHASLNWYRERFQDHNVPSAIPIAKPIRDRLSKIHFSQAVRCQSFDVANHEPSSLICSYSLQSKTGGSQDNIKIHAPSSL